MTDEQEVVEATEILALAGIIEDTNKIVVQDAIKNTLVTDLTPIADRIAMYREAAETMEVTNEDEATEAAGICDEIATDLKRVKDHEVLSGIVSGLHTLHRKWTGFRGIFSDPMEKHRKALKAKVIEWQEEERIKAEQAQRKLQAEADKKAREEAARLQKKAETVKKPETKERYEEEAASVVAPSIEVTAPKTNMRVQRVWAVKSINENVFFQSLSSRMDCRGYVKIDEQAMKKAKAANVRIEIPGVEFEQKVR